MAIYTELPIYKHGCDLLSLALDVQVQMPRVFKRSLGDRIHAQCVSMLEAMAMANASRGDDRVAQVAALTKDAGRYAFLRDAHEGDEAEACCVFAPNDMRECLVPVGSLPGELDGFIDAAIAAQKGTP